jgi:hypothetical protein
MPTAAAAEYHHVLHPNRHHISLSRDMDDHRIVKGSHVYSPG